MRRSEEDLLQQVYRRSAEIRRRRTAVRGASGLMCLALVGGLVVPNLLRSGTFIPGSPGGGGRAPEALEPSRTPPGGSSSPCGCKLNPGALGHREPGSSKRPAREPVVAPTDYLAFASDRDGNGHWAIYTMKADGSGLHRLTHGHLDREPSWSPDGKRIAFVRLENLEDIVGDVYLINADGSGLRFLTKGGGPKWSPDGTTIAFQTYDAGSSGPLFGAISVIHPDGSGRREVTKSAADPTWTPAGDRLLFGGLNDGITNVTAVDLDGSNRTQITTNPVFACYPDVSPNGDLVAYIAAGGDVFHLEVIDIEGKGPSRALTETVADKFALEVSPSWAPDGRVIAIERDPDGDVHYGSVLGPLAEGSEPSVIVLVAADGSRERTLSGGRYSYADPAFAPRAP